MFFFYTEAKSSLSLYTNKYFIDELLIVKKKHIILLPLILAYSLYILKTPKKESKSLTAYNNYLVIDLFTLVLNLLLSNFKQIQTLTSILEFYDQKMKPSKKMFLHLK